MQPLLHSVIEATRAARAVDNAVAIAKAREEADGYGRAETGGHVWAALESSAFGTCVVSIRRCDACLPLHATECCCIHWIYERFLTSDPLADVTKIDVDSLGPRKARGKTPFEEAVACALPVEHDHRVDSLHALQTAARIVRAIEVSALRFGGASGDGVQHSTPHSYRCDSCEVWACRSCARGCHRQVCVCVLPCFFVCALDLLDY